MKRRVVITGLGVVSPIGTGVEKFWSNLVAGVSGIDIIKRFDPVEIGLSVHIAGVLVKTGKFRPEDLKKSIEPFAILESVADLPRFLSNINSL